MILDTIARKPLKLLMFRYFIAVLLFLGCKDDSSKNEDKNKQADTELEVVSEENEGDKTILFFGDSLTAGYGLEDSSEAYPALIQAKIDSLGLNYKAVNSGVSGETSSGGLSRINWVLNQEVDVFVLELGANDGLRGVSLSETRENLQAIINSVKEKYPKTKIIMAGMQLPPNLGKEYTEEFRKIFIELAEKNNTALIPFLLKDVGGIPELNLPDGIHPNVEGQKIVAENVWEVLAPIISE